jgi:hypothetical protein
MTDKELLEWAAKAAGIEHPGGDHSTSNDRRLWDCKGLRWWNPLTDDGDALRLAVKLQLDLWIGHELVWARSEIMSSEETYQGDPYAATRRAVVRSAAEIGKEMK